MPHKRLQEFVIVDYAEEMVLLAVIKSGEIEQVIGLGQYYIDKSTLVAEVAFVVRDDHQGKGVGTELLSYLTYLAKRRGVVALTAEALVENRAMLHLFEKMGFTKQRAGGMFQLRYEFQEDG